MWDGDRAAPRDRRNARGRRELELAVLDDDDRESGFDDDAPVHDVPLEPEVLLRLGGQDAVALGGREDPAVHVLGRADLRGHGLKGEVEAQPQVPVARTVECEAVPLEEDRQIRGLLQFEQEHPRADGMQLTGWDVDDVTGLDLALVQQPSRAVVSCQSTRFRQPVAVHVLPQPEVHGAAVEDVPGLGLAERRCRWAPLNASSGCACTGSRWPASSSLTSSMVDVAERRDVLRTEPRHGVCGDRVGEQARRRADG